jgi:hypothetical protein
VCLPLLFSEEERGWSGKQETTETPLFHACVVVCIYSQLSSQISFSWDSLFKPLLVHKVKVFL